MTWCVRPITRWYPWAVTRRRHAGPEVGGRVGLADDPLVLVPAGPTRWRYAVVGSGSMGPDGGRSPAPRRFPETA